ncbi:MAG: SDR family oxidoreductase [Proteobacteria bacterium]|jgi:hypothetical protein|nr:SDR family oxidoreductase [Pseudomonadota bacterium]
MEIRGSQVMITGCNRGIGKAVALMAAADGAHLHVVNRKSDPELLNELTNAGAASVTFYSLDLGRKENIDQFLKETQNLQIDILFNNAGLLTGGLLENQTVDEIYAMLQVNVNALIHLTHGFLPRMIAAKKGKIINHASVTGVMHFPCATTYAASKAAVIAFTDSLRVELKGTGVTTLVLVTPGIETDMYKDIPNRYGKNIDLTFMKGMPTKKYAQMIREAILEDLDVLKPQGFSGVGVLMAQHAPKLFESLVLKRFQR